jgi:hypothetical protein
MELNNKLISYVGNLKITRQGISLDKLTRTKLSTACYKTTMLQDNNKKC